MTAQFRKYCSDLPDDTHECCTSCHEDCDEGHTDLIEVEKDGVLWWVCCNKANLLDGKTSTR